MAHIDELTHEMVARFKRSKKEFFSFLFAANKKLLQNNRTLRISYMLSLIGYFLIIVLYSGVSIRFIERTPFMVTVIHVVWFVIVSLFISGLLILLKRENTGDQESYLNRFHLPNQLTIIRLLSIPFLYYLVYHTNTKNTDWLFQFTLIFGFFIAFSDVLDGLLSRIFRLNTIFGRVLDPITDIVFNSAIALCFYLKGDIPIWFLFLVLFRYWAVFIGGCILFVYKKPFAIIPSMWGKITAVLIGVLFLSLYVRHVSPFLFKMSVILFSLTLCSLIVTIGSFVKKGISIMRS